VYTLVGPIDPIRHALMPLKGPYYPPLITLTSIPVIKPTHHSPLKSHNPTASMHSPNQHLPRPPCYIGRVKLDPPRSPTNVRLAHRPHQVSRVEDPYGGVVRANCEFARLVRRGLDGGYTAGETAAIPRYWCRCGESDRWKEKGGRGECGRPRILG
jgi:hypothetical protein